MKNRTSEELANMNRYELILLIRTLEKLINSYEEINTELTETIKNITKGVEKINYDR